MKNLRLNKEMLESLAVLRTTAERQQLELINNGINPSWTNFKKTDYYKKINKTYTPETIQVFKNLWLLKV